MNMFRSSLWCMISVTAIGSPAQTAPELRFVHNEIVEDGMEILAYDPFTRSLLGVGGDAQYIYSIDEQGVPTLQWREVFNRQHELLPTSITADPAGRGFAASTWIPMPVDAAPGMVQFIDLKSRTLVWQLPAGMHPDCVMFTPDGRFLLLANECEPGMGNLPGGLSLIDLSSVSSIDDLRGLNEIEHIGFEPEHLGEGLDLGVLRISANLVDQPTIDIEPEYLAPTNEGVWVSLQENNALGYFDFAQRKWTRILALGTMRFAFDASDEDGISLSAGEGFALLHEPDTIELVRSGGREMVLLANEGEQDDDDLIKLGDAIKAKLIDPNAIQRLNTLYGDVVQRFGKLRISTIDGDLDADGDIDVPTAVGGRSISLFDSASGIEIWNSGSQIELITALRYPELYNAGDSRSDNAGPEPEGLAVGEIDGRTIAFVGLERTDVIMMYDLTDPLAPRLLAMQRLEEICSSPEGLVFIDTGPRQFLGVGSEKGEGCLSIYEILLSDE